MQSRSFSGWSEIVFYAGFSFNVAAWLLLSGAVHAIVQPAITSAAENSDTAWFDEKVAPIFIQHCLSCHNSGDRRGGLDLSQRDSAEKGGDSGVIVSGRQPEDSLLFQRVHAGEMPPAESKQPKLTEAEIAILREWIAAGSKWGSTPLDMFRFSTTTRAGADWWSLQPVNRPKVPAVKDPSWCRQPIDAFVLAKLEEHSFSPAPVASRETLIRRVFFDLIGLPPSPEEVEEFVGSEDPKAWEKLIDRLLSSPHYGERWARHWLDVARYTESQGFEYDRFRPNAWHYRDYVIASLNSDKPYNLFLQEQIAGDVANFEHPGEPATSEGIIASSLLVCGPWDQAGNAQANVTQRKTTREEELEDLVSVIGQTFLGMTVNCSRCHSHKFDPISQEDYYRFRSIFDGVKHGERSIETPSEAAERDRKAADVRDQLRQAEDRVSQLEESARKAALAAIQPAKAPDVTPSVVPPAPFARWTFDENTSDLTGTLNGDLRNGATVRNGRLVLSGDRQFLQTSPLDRVISEKTLEAWVVLSTADQGGGGVLTLETDGGGNFDSIVFAERQPKRWMAGSAGFGRTIDVDAPDEDQFQGHPVHVAVVYRGDNSIAVFRNGEPWGNSWVKGSLQSYRAGSRILMGLRHTGAGNGFLKGEIESASLYDRALTASEIKASFSAGHGGGPVVTQDAMLTAMTSEQRRDYDRHLAELKQLQEKVSLLSRPHMSYVGMREQPEPARRLERGQVTSPAEIVTPGALSVIANPNGDFGLPSDSPEADRRIQLARWLADPNNPLPARVMVNRIWLYHFGRGIVDTPSDFGFNGARPTHPELLDWLAAEFVHGPHPWSIHHLHRLILTSAAYQQSADLNPKAAETDSDNRLLWRFAPRRLEGEIIRDAMLAVSGQLNPKVGGPSFRPFTVTNHGSDFYHLADLTGPEFNRRTIYRAHINSGKSPLMDALDCPDPSIKTPARRVTTTPLAALALMNNSFVQRQANSLAERIRTESGDEPDQNTVRAFQICFSRKPSKSEMESSRKLQSEHGLKMFCWALLNASEFVYVR
ncbi:MAG: DUF1553 domain-containing protein, partial [Planctomyces sp.]